MEGEYNVNRINEELKTVQSSKYYGQWETDRIIEQYFEKGYKGCCIEVGAADGIKGSNTKFFEDQGWEVLCIEPNYLFKESLKARKNVLFYAVSDKNTEGYLKVFKVGDKSIMSSISSLNPDDRLVEDHSHIIKDTFKIKVPVRTLPAILETLPIVLKKESIIFEGQLFFDFISIDTEGTELDVLKGWDFDKYKVHLFVVENNYDDSIIVDFMKSKNYVRDQRYKINDFYVREN